jgi:hypothetical protein
VLFAQSDPGEGRPDFKKIWRKFSCVGIVSTVPAET